MEDASANQGVYRRAIQGGKWLSFGFVAQRLLNFVTFFILARVLSPSDYGIIAIVFLSIDLLDNVLTPGFSTALLQTDKETATYLSTVWTFDVVKGIAIALLLAASSGFISTFFNIPNYRTLIALSGVFIIIATTANSRQLYFFKELDFKKVFLRDFVSQIVYTICAIAWALFMTANVWALFVGQLGRYLTSFVMSYILSPAMPRFDFHFSKLRDLIGYGKWIYGQNILNYILISLDKILIGRLLDSRQLGLYSRARDLPTMVSAPLSTLISKVGFSAYAKVQNELDKIRQGFLKSFDLMVFATIPFSLMILLEGGALVSVLLGPKWLSIVIPLKIFSVGNIAAGIMSLLRPLFNAIGKPHINFKSTVLQIILTPPLLYYGISLYQVKGAAVGTVAVWFVVMAYIVAMAWPTLRLRISSFLAPVLSVFFASAGVVVLDLVARRLIHPYADTPIIFAWALILALFYTILIWLFGKTLGRGPWYTVVSVLDELGVKRPRWLS